MPPPIKRAAARPSPLLLPSFCPLSQCLCSSHAWRGYTPVLPPRERRGMGLGLGPDRDNGRRAMAGLLRQFSPCPLRARRALGRDAHHRSRLAAPSDSRPSLPRNGRWRRAAGDHTKRNVRVVPRGPRSRCGVWTTSLGQHQHEPSESAPAPLRSRHLPARSLGPCAPGCRRDDSLGSGRPTPEHRVGWGLRAGPSTLEVADRPVRQGRLPRVGPLRRGQQQHRSGNNRKPKAFLWVGTCSTSHGTKTRINTSMIANSPTSTNIL